MLSKGLVVTRNVAQQCRNHLTTSVNPFSCSSYIPTISLYASAIPKKVAMTIRSSSQLASPISSRRLSISLSTSPLEYLRANSTSLFRTPSSTFSTHSSANSLLFSYRLPRSPVTPQVQIVRHYSKRIRHKNARKLKTRQTAAKRFIETGNGLLKFKHCNKKHLNSHKSPSRLRRLSATGILRGTYLKKMKKLILTGK